MNIILLSNMKRITRSLCGIFVVCSFLFITGTVPFIATAGGEYKPILDIKPILKPIMRYKPEPILDIEPILKPIMEYEPIIEYTIKPIIQYKPTLEVEYEPIIEYKPIQVEYEPTLEYKPIQIEYEPIIKYEQPILKPIMEYELIIKYEPLIKKPYVHYQPIFIALMPKPKLIVDYEPILRPIVEYTPCLGCRPPPFFIKGGSLPHFTSSLGAGFNLISAPLNNFFISTPTLRDLAIYIGKENVEKIIYLKDNKFIGYTPNSPEDTSADVPVTGEEAYIVVMKSPANVTFIGRTWDGEVSLSKGLNLMSLPVNPGSWRLSDLASYIGPNLSSIIWHDKAAGRFVGFDPSEPGVGNTIIHGGQGYIVSMTEPAVVTFEGETWVNTPADVAPSPGLIAHNPTATPLLIIEGTVLRENTGQKPNGIKVTVRNLNTGSIVTTDTDPIASARRYIAILADLIGNRAARVGDTLEVTAQDSTGTFESEQIKYIITLKDVQVGKILLGTLSFSPIPKNSVLLANYPNPFNPETWIPYQLAQEAPVTINIYDAKGQLICAITLGNKNAGVYVTKSQAAYWDGKDMTGQAVSSGVYFYHLQAGDFSAVRKMVIVK